MQALPAWKNLLNLLFAILKKPIVPEGESGVVYFNPEYGDRLGVEAELEVTYKRMGDFLKKKCKGYFGYIFTGNLELG